jgi:hypothetical protein
MIHAENGGLHETAVSKLNAFINEVEAQRGNKLRVSPEASALYG